MEDRVQTTNLIEVLDRILDKGIVIDAWMRVRLVGIDLTTVERRVVVTSIETYLERGEIPGIVAPAAPLPLRPSGNPHATPPVREPFRRPDTG